MNKVKSPKSIIYYDTNCRLCNHYISFTSKRDAKTTTRPDSIYSILDERREGVPESIIFDENGTRYYRSTAVLKHWIAIGGYLKMIGYIGLLVPRFLRDVVYDFVAKRRYRWFGTVN